MTSKFAIKNTLLLASCLSVTLVAACGAIPNKTPNLEDAKFWQRNSASSALYLRGPKAQQMLHQDISRCVRDISELENLGEIRRAIPSSYNSGNTEDARLSRFDTPVRDGYLYAEHVDYHDFETCMYAKGWERVDYLPTNAADQARQNYLDRVKGKSTGAPKVGRENVTTIHQPSNGTPQNSDFNQ